MTETAPKKEYVENRREKIEIMKIKAEIAQEKFLTLKEFLLDN